MYGKFFERNGTAPADLPSRKKLAGCTIFLCRSSIKIVGDVAMLGDRRALASLPGREVGKHLLQSLPYGAAVLLGIGADGGGSGGTPNELIFGVVD